MAATHTLEYTKELNSKHPIFSKTEYLLDTIYKAWGSTWKTMTPIELPNGEIRYLLYKDTNPTAQDVGNVFERVLAEYLSMDDESIRQGSSKEKDILFTEDDKFSFEIKISGQSGGKIFGNASFNAKNANGEVETEGRKSKSGYYLCINFFEQNIYKIRIGWIDYDDWEAQKSSTGQAATLKDYVYTDKLVEIMDKRILESNPRILPGVGAKSSVPDSFSTIKLLCSYVEEILSIGVLQGLVEGVKPTNEIKKLDKDVRRAIKSEEFLTLYRTYVESKL